MLLFVFVEDVVGAERLQVHVASSAAGEGAHERGIPSGVPDTRSQSEQTAARESEREDEDRVHWLLLTSLHKAHICGCIAQRP